MADEGNLQANANLAVMKTNIRQSLTRKSIKYDLLGLMIQSFSDIRASSDLDETDALIATTDDIPGYAKHAQALHRILCTYATCSCLPVVEPGHHWARLRLKAAYELSRAELVQFDMVFSVNPNPPKARNYDWQGVQILVPV